MKPISLLRLPIFWLYLGPPIFRTVSRSAMESLSGNVDVWNVLRLAWWLFWGAVAVWELFKVRGQVVPFLKQLGSWPKWIAFWLFMLLLSTVVSPAPLFTLTNAAMLGVLILTALDLALKVDRGMISLRRVLQLVLIFSVALLVLVGVAYLIAPSLVVRGANRWGTRIVGNNVASVPILALASFFLGLYWWLTSRELMRLLQVIPIGLGFLFLMLAQTRSSYGAFMIGLGLFAWQWGQWGQRPIRLAGGIALVLVIVCAGALAGEWIREVDETLDYVQGRVVRHEASLTTASGRTVIIAYIIDQVGDNPLGLGFASGPRVALQTAGDALMREGVVPEGIGNAHNAHLEVFGGSGYLGLIAWLGVLFYLVRGALQLRSKSGLMLRILLLFLLFHSFFGSDLVLPFTQEPVLLWIIAGTVAGHGSLLKHRLYGGRREGRRMDGRVVPHGYGQHLGRSRRPSRMH